MHTKFETLDSTARSRDAGRPRVNLFIVGAMKCGTHALFNMLGQHQDICAASFKEPCHFIDGDVVAANWPAMRRYQPEQAYRTLFSHWRGERYLCEASTSYTKKPQTVAVAGRIHAYNPAARIVYVVRDPFRRAVSHYFHDYRGGRISLPILEAMRSCDDFVNVSDYATQIADFIELFGRDRVKIVISERLKANPERVFRDALDWLGLPPPVSLQQASEGDNHVTPPVIGQPTGLLRASGLRNSRLWRAMRDHSPEFMRALALRLLFKRPIRTNDYDQEALKALIGPRIADGQRRFSELIGDPVPEWPWYGLDDRPAPGLVGATRGPDGGRQ